MASTFSDRLKLELMETGANANTWGTNTNNNLDVIDAFSAGYLAKSVAGSANITLSTANASDTAEASNKTIELTGALTGDIVVFIPAVESQYTFFNNTSGSQTLTIAATGHTANGIAITQGAKSTVFCDGSANFNVEIASSTDLGSQTGTLPQVSGANLTNLNASNVASGTIANARLDAQLQDVAGLAVTNGGFIVGDGSNFVLETGATARSSIGLGTGDNVEFEDTQVDSFGVGTAASGTTGEIRATNDVTAFYSSDKSLKENIKNIENPLEKVSQINGVTFDWTEDYIKENGGEDKYFVRKNDVGVIAQEIEKVLPQVVATRENGIKAVKYDRIVALLIESVKELKKEIEELKSGA